MIGTRFLGLARLNGFAAEDAKLPLAIPKGFRLQLKGRNCWIYANTGARVDREGERALVMGNVYRSSTGYLDVSPEEIATLGAGPLVSGSGFWGNFVVFRDHLSGMSVYRSALGRLSCYYMQFDGWLAFASEVDLLGGCRTAGLALDVAALTDHIAYPHLRRERTCLEGVRELIGGQALALSPSGPSISTSWTPWGSVSSRFRDIDTTEAARSIRSAAMQSIGALSRPFEHIVLGVSGGLDSAIVACALANFGRKVTLVTLATPDPRGDERAYAQLLSRGIGLPLEEHFEDTRLVDPCWSQSAHLPRPLARAFAQSGDAILSEVAARVGGDAHFTGGGGDNVFCFLQSPAPVADLILKGRLLRALRCSGELGQMTGAGTAKALRLGIGRAFRRTPNYRWPRDARFLTKAATEEVPIGPLHPWLDYPRRTEPGASGHIAAILAIENHLEGYARELTLPIVHPLMSKPLVEAALAIPAWMWCADGRNRAVARDAFADLLPRKISERQTKGTPDGFVALVFAHNRARIRDFLCDGFLVNAGVLDRELLSQSLGADGMVAGTDFSRLLSLCGVEAWCQQRLGRRSA